MVSRGAFSKNTLALVTFDCKTLSPFALMPRSGFDISSFGIVTVKGPSFPPSIVIIRLPLKGFVDGNKSPDSTSYIFGLGAVVSELQPVTALKV
jgi:hypothetical protein